METSARSDSAHVGARAALGPLTELPGVGPVRARKLAAMGLCDLGDLLCLVPQRLEVWERRSSVREALAAPGSDHVVAARVRATRLLRFRGRRSMLRVTVADDTGELELRFFNQAWLKERLVVGETIEAAGRVHDRDPPALVVRRMGNAERPLPPPGALLPVYPLAQGVTPAFLGGLCRAAVARCADRLEELLPVAVLAEHGLPPLAEAVRALHEPPSRGGFASACRRVRLEPLLGLQAQLRRRREARRAGRALVVPPPRFAEALESLRLPFSLTEGQRRVTEQLAADLAQALPMRRLLQGDVGSGKTVVGLIACLAASRAGGTSAFLAPTELLAEQHFDTAGELARACGLRAVLLTGSLPAAERRDVLRQLERGEADLVFGTHALFSADVRYRRLALALIDEQHRFGVAQRQRLLDKGRDVHVLLMTATPIPRSLALTLYGDLDLSLLREKPPGRAEVRTRWLRGAERRRLLGFLDTRLARGERAFWVCARIGGEEGGDARGGAEARHARLLRSPLARHGVALVHGRLAAPERSRRLRAFRRGEVRLLVATTVVEVGVDVPAATVMVVEDADRLGLAQLHQLRGRVGRGGGDARCILLGGRSAAERFSLLEQSGDGFELAERDLALRGMGDLAGLRQTGACLADAGGEAVELELLLLARDLIAADDALYRAHLPPQAPAP